MAQLNVKFMGGIIFSDVKKDRLIIGRDITGYRASKSARITLLTNSQWIVNGTVKVYQGASVLVGKEATLSMGNGATLGDEAEIICKRRISVGEFSDITWQCQVTDYNSHFIMDCNTHRVNTIFREVVLGDYCWIGNRTTIQPGTRLPDRTIVASNSLLNKDYITKGIRPYSMIGGQPAKLIKTDVMRIYNRKKESVLLEHFLNFENMEEYVNYIDKED